MDYERLMSKKNPDGKDAVDLLNEASELMDRDKFKNAIGLLTEAIGLCGHPRFYFNRGYCYHQLKDKKNAIRDFTKCLVNDRGNDLQDHEKQRLYLYHGIIYEEMAEEEKAIEAYKKAADWGYAGAIARLEKLGIDDYEPQPIADSDKSSQIKTSQKTSPVKKPVSESSSKPASSSANAPLSTPKKKSKMKFLLPLIAGLICAVCVFLFFANRSGKSSGSSIIKITKINKNAAFDVRVQAEKAIITSDNINLYADPDAYSRVIRELFKGYVVSVTGNASGEWTPVEHEGVKGWVNSDKITHER